MFNRGLKSKVSSYKNENGNLVTDSQEIQRVWKQQFITTLQGNYGDSLVALENVPNLIKNDDYVDIPPSHDNVREASQQHKSNKATGHSSLPTQLFEAGGEKVVEWMH